MRFLFFALATSLGAQSFAHVSLSGGFKLGAPINQPSQAGVTDNRWTGGPTIELHLPRNFALEFDALYRTQRSSTNGLFRFDPSLNAYTTSTTQNTNLWDLPLLLKYRLPLRTFRPFLTGGYQWTHRSVEGSYLYQCTGPKGSCLPANAPFPEPSAGKIKGSDWVRSVAGGVGVEFKTRWLAISPELRISRPVNTSPKDVRFTGLVGFTFGRHH